MRAASTAALRALSTPTHATGTPGGICTIESSASSPSRTLSDERSGTPITGRSVCAATTPGSAAARPAPQISTRSPRSRAGARTRRPRRASRCAERTSNSYGIPRSSSSSSAGCIRSRSDSEPTRMPTSGRVSQRAPSLPRAAMSVPEAHARRTRSARPPRTRARAPRRGRRRAPVTSRIRPPFVTSCAVAQRRAGVEDERAGRLGVRDARRSACRCRRGRVVAARRARPSPRPPSRRRERRRRASSPAAAAASAASRSPSSRGRIDCVSGSPKRQLNSSTSGPSSVSISPA